MAKQFGSAAAFKSALEARLRKRAQDLGVPFSTLQLKFVIERLLARLFRADPPPWLLKGGFAMDLRFRPRARATKDIDLTVTLAGGPGPMSAALRERLQEAGDTDLGDFLMFRIGEPGRVSGAAWRAPQALLPPSRLIACPPTSPEPAVVAVVVTGRSCAEVSPALLGGHGCRVRGPSSYADLMTSRGSTARPNPRPPRSLPRTRFSRSAGEAATDWQLAESPYLRSELPLHCAECPGPPPGASMSTFIQRFGAVLLGVLCGFDRIRFRGTKRQLCYPNGIMGYLQSRGILFRDFKTYAQGVTESLFQAIEPPAKQAGLYQYLNTNQV